MKLYSELQEDGTASVFKGTPGSKITEPLFEHLHPLEARDIVYLVNDVGIKPEWSAVEKYLPEYPAI